MTLLELKLAIGQIITGWSEYPATVAALRAMPKGPPIIVTGAYRSGTTWIGRMLAIKGTWHIHEPFNPNKGLWGENFTYLRANSKNSLVDDIMDRLLSGRLILGPSGRILQNIATQRWLMPVRIGLFPKPPHRIIIKDPIACLMSEYISFKYSTKTIVVFRHPAGFASSLQRLGWNTAAELQNFLNCKSLMHDWLQPHKDLMVWMRDQGGINAASALYGCLCTVLWGFVNRNSNMNAIFFEQLCKDPIEEFSLLFNSLDLPYTNQVRELHLDLCTTNPPGGDYYPFDIRRNSEDMAHRWKQLLNAYEVNKIRRIWESFDLPIYKSEEDWRM